MKSLEFPERRSDTLNEALKDIGGLKEAVITLKSNHIQSKQDFVGHRAETLDMIKQVEGRVLEIIKPLAADVNSIKGYMRWGMGYGLGVGGTVLFILELYRTFSGR